MSTLFKNKVKRVASLVVSLALFSTPFTVKASPEIPENFGAPANFDWEAERQRQLKLFDEFDKKHSKGLKSNLSVVNNVGFPSDTRTGDVLVTKDSSKESSSFYVGHAALVHTRYRTIESSPYEDGVYKGFAESWMGVKDTGEHNKRTVYILKCSSASDPTLADE